jgi:proteasome activator subunit 4
MKDIRATPVPTKKSLEGADQEAFQRQLLEAHSTVLGASALILAWPYEVPNWLPELLVAMLSKFSTSRAPASTTVKDMLAQFRKTHQDTWVEDQKKFTSDQLQDLHDFQVGTSYYA